jgi:hypothetical protein
MRGSSAKQNKCVNTLSPKVDKMKVKCVNTLPPIVDEIKTKCVNKGCLLKSSKEKSNKMAPSGEMSDCTAGLIIRALKKFKATERHRWQIRGRVSTHLSDANINSSLPISHVIQRIWHLNSDDV